MTISVLSGVIAPFNSGEIVPAYLAVVANDDFVAADGTLVLRAHPDMAGQFGKLIPVTVVGNSIVADPADLIPTIDSTSDPNVTERLMLLDANKEYIRTLEDFEDFRVPLVSPTTWQAIKTYTDGAPTVVVTDMDQVESLIQAAFAAQAGNPALATIQTLDVSGAGVINPAAAVFGYAVVELTGLLTGNRTINWPVANTRQTIIFWNNTTGDFTLFVKATPEATATVYVSRGAQSILINDGTTVIDVTAAISHVPFYVLESDGVTPQTVDCGPFYTPNVDLGECFYECWAMLLPGGGVGCYDWSDGYGAVHAMLRSSGNGNIQTGAIITNATNASPIVITTQHNHGFTDGEQLSTIQGVLGNLGANVGNPFLHVLSPTTFSLFSDAGLSVPIAGTGAYTSGGIAAKATVAADGIVSWVVDDIPYINQWHHSATGVVYTSPGVGLVVHYYDGVPVAKVGFTGARMSLGGAYGSGRALMVGSDHSNFKGRLARYRNFENKNPHDPGVSNGSHLDTFVPETVFSGFKVAADGSLMSASLLMDFSRPEQIITDHSPLGHPSGIPHPGQIRGVFNGINTIQSSYPAPIYVIDPNAPNALLATGVPQPAGKVYAPHAVPGGAIIFDSIQRKNSTHAFDSFGGIGSTESGSAGPLVWQQPTSPFSPPKKAFGILNEKFVPLTADGGAYVAHVPVGQANNDIRMDRCSASLFGMGISTSVVFRYVDDVNFWIAATFGTTLTNQALYVYKVVAGVPTLVVAGVPCPANAWTTLKALTKTTGDYSVWCDGTSVASGNDAALQTGTGAGFGLCPVIGITGVGLAFRWQNFTVFNNP